MTHPDAAKLNAIAGIVFESDRETALHHHSEYIDKRHVDGLGHLSDWPHLLPDEAFEIVAPAVQVVFDEP